MELKKAIEVVRNIDTTDIHCKNCVLEEKDKCITDLFGYSCQRIAIDTVLEELNNRISKDEMENILDAVKQKREKEIEETGISLRGSAVDILENIIREKWNKE